MVKYIYALGEHVFVLISSYSLNQLIYARLWPIFIFIQHFVFNGLFNNYFINLSKEHDG